MYHFDEYGCFAIVDFRQGDSILLNKLGARIKGTVLKTDVVSASITYKDVYGRVNRCNLNDVVYLSYEKVNDWLALEA